MRVITTHLSADFDAFAAAVCAARLYPGYRVLFPGSQEAAVRRFLSDSGYPFPELRLRDARRARLEHVVVVDTRSSQRLGEVWDLIKASQCPVTLIDHHTGDDEDIGASEIASRQVGATCTIIASMMRSRGVDPTPEEASLLVMGIYEDTGGLSYRDTTPEDLRVAAWLLEQGGSLAWVRRWVAKGLQPEQLELLNRLVEGTEEIVVHGVPVHLALVEVDRYLEEAAYVVHRWVETFEIPVGIVLLVRPPHTNVIVRSRVQGLHAGRIAQLFGGGGHATAASARITATMPIEIRERLLRFLEDEMPPPVVARDIAAPKIFSVDAGTSVEDSKERLNHLRVNALPVCDEASGDLIGLVTRQILDRALCHGMHERPVKTIMQPGVPTVAATAALGEVLEVFLGGSHRFVVVAGDDGRPVGLITRMDLFRHLFERQHRVGSVLDHRMAGARPVSQSIAGRLRELTSPWVRDMIDAARAIADQQGISVYLVGGLVRDLLLDRSNEDVDLVVEGDGIAFAEALAAALDGRCHPHQPFLTAVLTLKDGHRVDVASARTEFYRTPAALPEVATSLIRQDLYRRDFTINALAVALHGDRHGELIDFFGGRKDLMRKELRVLHSLSFIDDPTRAVRAARYARRLGFNIAPDTRNLILTAVGEGVFARLSGQRLRRELELLLSEPHPAQSLALLDDLGLLRAISEHLVWDDAIQSFALEVEAQLAWYVLQGIGQPPPQWLLFMGALALDGSGDVPRDLATRLQVSGEMAQRLTSIPLAVAELSMQTRQHQRTSELVHAIERHPPEVLLLAMAQLDMDHRRSLAVAAQAAQKVQLPISGRHLVAIGAPAGPLVGRVLRQARDALIDGEINADAVLDFARQVLQHEASRC